ncbi:MAG: Uncharacterised protein [Cyanobium sp. ARS6]|nr:MAG: Uncharacterised protein [Cyanobium sp. ARS6]
MAGGKLPETRLEASLTGPEHNNLGIGIGQESIGDLKEQIHTLLINKARHHAQHKGVIARLKPHSLLQHALADQLPTEVISAVIRWQGLVCSRIPGLEIDAIEDSAQLACDVVQQPLQFFAVLGGTDLLRIGRRNGIDSLGIEKRRRHRVITLHVPGAPGHAVQLPAPGSLIFEVVDGEDRADFRVLMHPDRDHPRVPVMAVQHLGLPDIPGEFRRRTREEGEAPVFVFTAVDALRVEHGMPDQIERQAVGGMAGLEDCKFSAHGLGAPDGFSWNLQLAPELAVAGHDQANVMAELGQSRRQGTDHIAHTAHLHHGCTFSGGKQHTHGRSIRLSGATLSAMPLDQAW